MKKNFFKKLSFVLALAMIMSTIAPAGAFAATKKPKLNSATEYLFLGSGNDEQFDFNVKNTVKGYKYKWTSADKAIATVNQSGVVTAKGIGTTKVSVIVKNSKGKEVSSLKASVIVKDNIASLKITGTPAGDKVAVGKENAFTYSYTTKSGSTSQTTSVVAWKVDKAGATITDDGKFVATAAGSYKVTATAYQSKAKLAAGTALTSADYTVTVPNDLKSVTATKSTQLKVTFTGAATAVDKANFTVTNAATTSKLFIKAVTLSDDKTYATIDMYDAMVNGTTYSVAAKVDGTDMKGDVKYVKGTPTKIVAATTQTAEANKDYYVTYNVYDENGLDITADTTVYFESTTGVSSNGKVNLAAGAISYVYVYYINPTTGATIKSDKVTVSGVAATGTDLVTYTLSTNNNLNDLTIFSTAKNKTSITLNDADKNNYYVRFAYKDQYGATKYAAVPGQVATDQGITFENLDPSIFVVDTFSGKVTPIAAGTGYFRIKMGSNLNVVKSITVKADASLASLKPVSTSLSVSDTGNKGLTDLDIASKLNTAKLHVNYFNNYNEQQYDNGDYDLYVKVLSGNNLLTIAEPDTGSWTQNSYGAYDRTWTTKPAKVMNTTDTYVIKSNTDILLAAKSGITTGGTVALKIYKPDNQNIYTTVLVNVVPADNNSTGYVIDGLKQLNIEDYYDGQNWTNDYDTTLKVYSVDAAGYKISQMTDAATSIKVTGPNSKVETVTGGAFVLNTRTNPDFAFVTGDYNVEASRNNVVFQSGTFNIKDTGVKPSLSYNNNNDVSLATTLDTTTLENKLSGLGDFHVDSFSFTSGNSNVQASTAGYVTSIALTGQTTLYNVKVKVVKNVNDLYSSVVFHRYFEISIPNLDVQ